MLEINTQAHSARDKCVMRQVCDSAWQVQGTRRQTNILVAFTRTPRDSYAPHVTLYTEALSSLDLGDRRVVCYIYELCTPPHHYCYVLNHVFSFPHR